MITMAPRYNLEHLRTTAGLTRRELRTHLGISNTTHQHLDHVGLTDEQADRYAVRLGYLPWAVWDTWLTDWAGTVPPDQSQCDQP